MRKLLLMLVMGLYVSTSVTAQDESFFTDPSLLKPWDQGTFVLRYIHPDILRKSQRYNSVMIDQPEIQIAADSKYKSAKGDHLKQLADVGRLAMIERLEAGGWTTADEPGPNVMYMRWAISDLYLKKKKRGILSYTPVGFVAHTTAQAAIRDLWKKIDIVELGVMMEWTDSVSGEVLGARLSKQGLRKAEGQKQDLVTWEDLEAFFRSVGEQMRCSLDNNKLGEGKKRLDCGTVGIQPIE